MKDRVIKVANEFLARVRSREFTAPLSAIKGLEFVNKDPQNWVFSHFARDLDPYGRLIAVFHGKKKPVMKSIGCPYGGKGDFVVMSGTKGTTLIKIDDIQLERFSSCSKWLWVIKFHIA